MCPSVPTFPYVFAWYSVTRNHSPSSFVSSWRACSIVPFASVLGTVNVSKKKQHPIQEESSPPPTRCIRVWTYRISIKMWPDPDREPPRSGRESTLRFEHANARISDFPGGKGETAGQGEDLYPSPGWLREKVSPRLKTTPITRHWRRAHGAGRTSSRRRNYERSGWLRRSWGPGWQFLTVQHSIPAWPVVEAVEDALQPVKGETTVRNRDRKRKKANDKAFAALFGTLSSIEQLKHPIALKCCTPLHDGEGWRWWKEGARANVVGSRAQTIAKCQTSATTK